MDERLETILRSVGGGDIAKVAADVLGVAEVRPGPITLTEITAPHSDARTIGIVKVSGTAVIGAETRPWSSVTKLVDLTMVGTFTGATIPQNEEIVYERGHFANSGLSFRPARCYHISRLSETLKVLWLEDLTGAKGAPFSLDELAQMVRHLGEWNAVTAATPPDLGFATARDYQRRRWVEWRFADRAGQLVGLQDDPWVRAMYADTPLAVAREYFEVLGELNRRSVDLPHVLSFGDGPIGNYFYLQGETIAVDWSGLSVDPIGADGGCFIGSALTWGRQFVETALHERELFEDYATGVWEGGSTLPRGGLRAAYLSHLGFYLGTMAIFPTMLRGPSKVLPDEFVEKRLGMPVDEVGAAMAPLINLLPSYIEEARELLAQGAA